MNSFVKLGDACLVRRGTTITRKQTKKGNVPVIAGGRQATYFHNQHNRKPGTITVSGSGASAGLVNYWQTPIFASDCSTIELKDKKQNIKFVYYYMQSMQELIYKEMRSGAAQPHVYAKDIANLDFPLISLKEQQRIVAKLDKVFSEIDEVIELTKKNISNFKSYYSYTIDKEFSKYSNELKQIGDYSKINYGYTAKASFDKGNYKLLRITDIQNNSVDWNTVPYCNVESHKLSSVILKHGDIVFARTGATTGKSFLIQNPVNSVFASYLIRISVDREILLPTFVMHFFQSAKYWQQVNDGISGSAQGGFNSSKLSQLKIPIISKSNQQKLVEKFDLINEYSSKLQDYYYKKSIHLYSLRQAILSKELVVKQKEVA